MKWRAVGFLVVVVIVAVGLAGYDYWADHRYRNVRSGDPPQSIPVLFAKQLIPKGTSGWVVAYHQSMYGATTLPPKEVEAGAISNPGDLRSRAAAVDILPGQQFTETNFTASASAPP